VIIVAKFLRKPISRRKDLFWLMVFRVSICGCLAPLLFDLWQGRKMAEGVVEENCLIHGS
jgi:hypothetical protein